MTEDIIMIAFLLLCSLSCALATPSVRVPSHGLQAAVNLIKAPLDNVPPIKDIILSGVADRWENQAYKLQVLRQRIGYAWELVMTDFGFQRYPTGVDLIHPRRKLAIELKNSCRISSASKRAARKMLLAFKRIHPTYTVILGCINYKNLAVGGTSMRGQVTYLKGRYFLQYLLQHRKDVIIRRLKEAAREFVRSN